MNYIICKGNIDKQENEVKTRNQGTRKYRNCLDRKHYNNCAATEQWDQHFSLVLPSGVTASGTGRVLILSNFITNSQCLWLVEITNMLLFSIFGFGSFCL